MLRRRTDLRFSSRATLLATSLVLLCLPCATAAQEPPLQHLGSAAHGGSRILVAPDHLHVYVAEGERLDIYERDDQDGTLTWLGFESSESFNGALAFSPDGLSLYTAGRDASSTTPPYGGALDVFARDPGTGALRLQHSLVHPSLWGASTILPDPEGRHVYVGIVNEWPGDGFGGFITRVAFDGPNGAPRLVFTFETARIEGMALTDGGTRLVAVENEGLNFTGPLRGRIRSYLRSRATGRLVDAGQLSDADLYYAGDLAISPDGRFVYVAADGSISFPLEHQGRLYVYRREPGSGVLTPLGYLDSATSGLEGLTDIRELSMRSDGEQLLAIGRETIVVFARDEDTGSLTKQQTIDLPSDPDLLWRRGTATYGPGGSRVYAAHPQGLDVFGQACRADDSTFCFRDQGRFQVDITWHDFEDGVGRGRVVPVLSDDSGLFWFFRDGNWEVLTKVLDGCNANGHFWVFGAATTNVGYTLRVTDTWTGTSRAYDNPLGRASPAVVDNRAFATCDATPGPLAAVAPPPVEATLPEVASCGSDQLCLRDGRFVARVTWRDFRGDEGTGQVAAPMNDTSGLFWFFREDNWEMLVKVLGGCNVNGHFWVLAAATTNVGYTLEIEDTQTGTIKTYDNALGQASPATIDTRAFLCSTP